MMKITLHYHDAETFEFDIDENGKPIQPKCSACGGSLTRQKCLFDMNPAHCPRHDQKTAYDKALQKWVDAEEK